MLLSLDLLSCLLAHFHLPLSNHSIRIHSPLYMSHLSLLMNYIYMFMLTLHSLLHFMLLMLMLPYSFQTMHYNYCYSSLILVLYCLLLHLSYLGLLHFITWMFIMLAHYRYLPMLTLFHSLLYMFHYLLHHNSLLYMFHYFMLSSHTYYALYNYAILHSYNPNFMLHLYIINSTFMPHLSSYSIMHLILNYLDLLLLSLSLMLPLLASSFTNSMQLLILHLYISTLLSDSLTSMSMYL